jgi:replicative DNA helicase
MLVDKNATIQVIGCILKNCNILDNTEQYVFNVIDDFTSNLERIVFSSILNLHSQGIRQLNVIDIENYLENYQDLKNVYKKENGFDFISDAIELSDSENFNYYYNRFKKFSALRLLKKSGYDVSELYCEDFINEKASIINKKFDELSIEEMFDNINNKILKISDRCNIGKNSTAKSASSHIDDLIKKYQVSPEIGPSFQGEIFNTICRGARPGKFYIRSSTSGGGKTRSMVGDACYMAYPIRYNSSKCAWELTGQNNKIFFISTEQDIEEIQTLILAYLTDINEEIIITGTFNEEQFKILEQAKEIIEEYKDNLFIYQIENPSVSKVKSAIRENCRQHNFKVVFYDYIFSSPSLLNEFRDLRIREDVALFLLSTALKDIAVELQVSIFSATQLSGDPEEKKGLRDATLIQGSKAIINKADIGVIVLPVTKEEHEQLHELSNKYNIKPNIVTDIHKVRRGSITKVKIWSYIDLGTCRIKDLFITSPYFEPVDFAVKNYCFEYDGLKETINFLDKINQSSIKKDIKGKKFEI